MHDAAALALAAGAAVLVRWLFSRAAMVGVRGPLLVLAAAGVGGGGLVVSPPSCASSDGGATWWKLGVRDGDKSIELQHHSK